MTREEKIEKLEEECEKYDDCEYGCPFIAFGSCNFKELSNKNLSDMLAKIEVEKSNAVNHPKHYQGNHECIDEMISLFGLDAVIGFCKCNVYKYRYRADRKNGYEDIEKADWYMDKLMELEKEEK